MSSVAPAPAFTEMLASLNAEQYAKESGSSSVNVSVQAASMATSRPRHQGDCISSEFPVEMDSKQQLTENKPSSCAEKWLSSISNQRACSAQGSLRQKANSCTGKWLSSLAKQEAYNANCTTLQKASSSSRPSCASKRPATVAALPSMTENLQGLLPTLHQNRFQPSSQRDPAVLPPAGGRLPFRLRSVRAFPSAPNQQSVVDQVVFGQDMDFSGEEKFDQGYLCLFSGCAGMASWDGCTGDAADLRFEEISFKPSNTAVDTTTPEVKPRRQGKMLVPDAPAQKSIVDTVVFGRDMDSTGDAQFQAAYLGMFHKSAGKPSHFVSPRGLKKCPVPGSTDNRFPRATTAPLSISPRRRRCPGGRLQKISVGELRARQPLSARVH